MNQNKKQGLNRANQLQNSAADYLRQKTSIPLGTEDSRIMISKAQKHRILELFNIGEQEWSDWHWQMDHRISHVESLSDIISLADNEILDIREIESSFRWAVSPYYLSLINPEDSQDAIKKMTIPVIDELNTGGHTDPMKEVSHNPSGSITRRYPDRLIINVTNACGSYCRHCQRRRNIGSNDCPVSEETMAESINYIRQHNEIRDVLITGGDPLTLENDKIVWIVSQIRSIPHVEIIRIGTRMPVVIPQRITSELVQRLKPYQPIYINIQFNHPQEITPDSAGACSILADNGFVLGNQMVLLKGVNDHRYTVRLLNQNLLKLRVRPYYIFHAKNVKGTLHFQTSIQAGINILKDLRGNTSGLAIPTYIINAPEGLGKIPLNYQYLTELQDNIVKLETWEGKYIYLSDVGGDIDIF